MIVPVTDFIDTLFIDMSDPEITLPAEVKRAAPVMKEHMEKALEHFKLAPEEAHILMGQHILTHEYGELTAIRFRRWIEANYVIGSDDSCYAEGRLAA